MGSPASDHPILVVDDEPENLSFMERFLRKRFSTIHLANDGDEAVSVLKREKVSLILTDQRMPGMFGTELLKIAQELQPDAVRVLVTGHGDVETLTAAINGSHVYQVVIKPLDLKVMEMVIARAIEAHEAARRERELFEAFVFASVSAIEARDPSTAGHSFRVAKMTTGLAMVVDSITDGPLASVKFSRDDLEQIRFASLLHDYGKIGVPEAFLVKSHKLPPARRDLFEQRIRHARETRRIDGATEERLLAILHLLNSPDTTASVHDKELRILEASGLCDDDDLRFLRIEHGSLSREERAAVQAHVQGTIRFLKQLPWPDRLSRTPEIAGAHHEKLDGTGYPTGTTVIPVESRMMTICDIYDALCAADRPYKTAVPHERAVEILMNMALAGSLDTELLDAFFARKVYRAINKRSMSAWG
jgi:response regulator RpfG family c-di-GMP phosphodiesterase